MSSWRCPLHDRKNFIFFAGRFQARAFYPLIGTKLLLQKPSVYGFFEKTRKRNEKQQL